MSLPNPTRRRSASLLAVVAVALTACSSANASRGSVEVEPRRVSRTSTTTHPTAAPRPATTTAPTTTPRPSTTLPATTRPTGPALPAAPATVQGVFAVGDSVMLGAARQLRARGIAVDAVESRQWNTGTSILATMAAGGRLPRVVVVHLGTNGPISGSQFDAMMRVLNGHRVVFMTAHEPRWWQNEVNMTLRAGVARWPGTTLLDWDAASTLHPEWFWSDRIHLRPAGAQAYAALVAGAA